MADSFTVFYDDIDNIYLFITVASRRAHQLYRGARPRLPVSSGEKPTVTAMRETLQGLVQFKQEYEFEKPDTKMQSMNISFM